MKARFRDICQTALEGLAIKQLNLNMLVERRARAQERRVVPEKIARFMSKSAENAGLRLSPVRSLPHTFDSGRTPSMLRQYEHDPDWRLPDLANRYRRISTDRDTADEQNLEWVTPGHPLFEALRRNSLNAQSGRLQHGGLFPLPRSRQARTPGLLPGPCRRRSRTRSA